MSIKKPLSPTRETLACLTRWRKQTLANMPALRILEAACLKHGASMSVSAYFGLSVSISKTVDRIGEIAPLLRAARQAGFPAKAMHANVKDDPAFWERVWSCGPEPFHLSISARLKADGKCRFVKTGETETTIPATEARIVRTPVYKLMCE